MNILITNPTGRIGRRMLPELLAPEFSVRVIVRDPARLPEEVRQQVEVVRGSTDDVSTLRQALDGVDALFWCVPTESFEEKDVELHYERFACAGWQAIRQAETPRVVTISAGGKGRSRNAGRISGLHAMEEILNESGAAICHLRCGLFMENFLSQVRCIREQGLVSYPMPGLVRVPMTAVSDIADAALRKLVRRDWHGIQGIAVHGPEDLSYNQAAVVLERILERPVRYRQVSPNDYVRALVECGASAEYARSVAEMFSELAQGITRAEPRTVESTTPTTLAAWAESELRPAVESQSETMSVLSPCLKQAIHLDTIHSNGDYDHEPQTFHNMKLLIVFLCMGIFAIAGLAADQSLVWPRFRGPDGSGVADGQKPPVEFGPDKNVRWKVQAPSGLSSPIVAGDNLVISAFEDGKLYTIAYNRADGKEAWRAEAPAKQLEAYHKTEGSPAASTPATDGRRIVSYFGSCGLLCYDLAGKQLWKYEMPTAATAGDFGSGASPILVDGVVVLVRDEKKDSKILALDASNGSRKWEQKRLSPASYCTPIVWNTASGKQIVAAGHARMIGYDLKSGAEKWFLNGMPSGCCPSPVTADGTLFFAGGGPSGPDDKEMQMPSFDTMLKDLDKDGDGALSREEAEKTFQGFFDNQDANKDGKITRDEWDTILKFMSEGKNTAFALKPGGAGDVSTSHVLWKATKGVPYLSSAIVYRGQCVMVKDGGVVTAYDPKTGKELYQERVATGKYYASPVAANGNIYFTSMDDGTITVLKAGSDKPEVLATNPKLGERIAATPAIADDTLFVRTDKNLYAFAEKK